MAPTRVGSWRRWLRPLAVIVWLASFVAASFGVAFGLTASVLLLTSLLFPLLWPRQFGSWRGLLLLLLAILAPLLAAAAIWPRLAASWPDAASLVLAWGLAAWMMLPATLALLLWRRLASIPIMLLGLAVMPAASLAVLTLSPPNTAAPSGDAPTMMRLLAAMTPMWFVTLACCLGPLFFLGTLTWLLYLEATRGEKKTPAAITPAPSARAGVAPRNAGSAGPTEN